MGDGIEGVAWIRFEEIEGVLGMEDYRLCRRNGEDDIRSDTLAYTWHSKDGRKALDVVQSAPRF